MKNETIWHGRFPAQVIPHLVRPIVPDDKGKLRPLNKSAVVVLLALYCYVDHRGECFPSQETLAGVTGYGRRTIQRAIRDLVKSGLIDRRQRGRHNVYILSHVVRQQVAPQQSREQRISNRAAARPKGRPPVVEWTDPMVDVQPADPVWARQFLRSHRLGTMGHNGHGRGHD